MRLHLSNKPTCTLILDIDGVLNKFYNKEVTKKKVKELFPDHRGPYTDYMYDCAAAHFFDQNALKNLNTLINKAERFFQIQIVLSSNWRRGRTVRELRSIFSIHSFSKYIIDKTIDDFAVEGEHKHYCQKDQCCRAAEIKHWLKKHPEVTNFLIFDDKDDHLSDHFGDRFIKTDYETLLTTKIANKALNFLRPHKVIKSVPINDQANVTQPIPNSWITKKFKHVMRSLPSKFRTHRPHRSFLERKLQMQILENKRLKKFILNNFLFLPSIQQGIK